MSTFPPSAATDPNLPHDSLVPQIIGICSAMLVLVTLVIVARFWVRWTLVKARLGPDDWCILVSWVLAVAFDLAPINQTRYGFGRHIYDLSPDTNFSVSLKLYYFGEILYYLCAGTTKVAILILYLRLAVQRTYRMLIWACMVFVILTALSCVIASILQCTPVHKAWDAAENVAGSCFNVNALFFANAGLDILQDALIYVLPMKMLYGVKVPRRQKIALMFVFAVGGFVVVSGMVRLYSLKVAQDTPDPSYDNFGAAVWSSIECNIGIVCASLPYFKPLIDRFYSSLMGYSRGSPKMVRLANGPAGSKTLKQSQKRSVDQTELELERGISCNDSYAVKYTANCDYSVTANGNSSSAPNSSEGHISSEEAHGIHGGIQKSMSVVISRD
ncbi:hypothetical protein GJ744_005239 [Endocarpon pusillum]|uniref:Rhodopsin domain-containing protein n=1 Tax=Endocarpon pusillum TaxID=364733 RepID=A0A8H7ACF2_9EURO|nr:hypothetical protein GJ744_005239 [Endocarpon pusillum]